MSGPTVVVGAGPAGSLLSIYLARQGHDVMLYESRPDLRGTDIDSGRSINLALATRGIVPLIDVGVIDLRSLVPLDMETVLEHAATTGRVLVAHEAWRFGGFGAEIAAQSAAFPAPTTTTSNDSG